MSPGLPSMLGYSPVTRVPQNIGDGRFGNWIANARDWNISRNRYWGTPIPLWASEDFEEVLIPTSEELSFL